MNQPEECPMEEFLKTLDSFETNLNHLTKMEQMLQERLGEFVKLVDKYLNILEQ